MYRKLPTHKEDWVLTARATRLVVSRPLYAINALFIAFLALSLWVVSQNLRLFIDVVVFGGQPFTSRFRVLVGLYPFTGIAYPLVESLILVILALLVGVNASLLVFYFRRNGLSIRKSGGGFGGLVLGTFGAGCAACGPAVLSGVLSLIGVGVGFTFLPLDGLEFSLAAVPLLLLSTYWIALALRDTKINGCQVDPY